MTTDEWSCLISFAMVPPTCKEGKQANNSKWKYMSLPSIKPATLWFLAGHIDRLAIDTVDNLCVFLNSSSTVKWQVMRGASPNTWQYNNGFTKNVYVLQQNFRQHLHFFHRCRCYLLLFTFKAAVSQIMTILLIFILPNTCAVICFLAGKILCSNSLAN